MNCKNLKQKLNKTLYCKKKNKIIKVSDCSNCKYREYKPHNNRVKPENTTDCHIKSKYRQKSKKMAKLEKNRFSILVSSTKCCMCPSTTDLTWHEIFRGKNRSNSMKYGLCLRLCYNCHERYQENKNFNDYWHKQAQIMFIRAYPNLDFLKIFKKNYL